jgi:dethiobiotin synthetase
MSPDAELAAGYAGWTVNDDLMPMISPVRYAAPVSPHVAARLEGRAPDWAAVNRAMTYWRGQCDLMIVEGAGGWLVPLDDDYYTIADLAAALKLPVAVVHGVYLGSINHTWLTVESIRQRGLQVIGLVANQVPEPIDFAGMSSIEEMPLATGVPLLARLPHRPTATLTHIPEEFIDALEPFTSKWKETNIRA